MKTIKLIGVNFRKIFTSPGFYASIALTALLCFTSEIYFDAQKMQSYSVISALLDLNKKILFSDTQLCSFSVFNAGNGVWVLMFIPIVAAFSFIPILCVERESKAIRYSSFRIGKFSFNFGNFLTSFLSGGLAVLLGFILFGVCIYFMFPNISEYSKDAIYNYKSYLEFVYPEFSKSGFAPIILRKLLEMFFFGAASAIPAYLLTGFMKNKYLVICIPFFAKYAFSQLNGKLMSQAYSDYENPNEKLSEILEITNTNALGNLDNLSVAIWKVVVFNAALLVIAFFIYNFAMNRRVDYGE